MLPACLPLWCTYFVRLGLVYAGRPIIEQQVFGHPAADNPFANKTAALSKEVIPETEVGLVLCYMPEFAKVLGCMLLALLLVEAPSCHSDTCCPLSNCLLVVLLLVGAQV